MIKKIKFLIVGVFVLIVGASVAYAQSESSTDLLKSVNVLGVSLVRSSSVKLYVVDTSNQTTSQDITLPTLNGNNGLIYAFKVTNPQNDLSYFRVHPASGEKIEGITDKYWQLGDDGAGEFAILAADEANGTWWLISQGMPIE